MSSIHPGSDSSSHSWCLRTNLSQSFACVTTLLQYRGDFCIKSEMDYLLWRRDALWNELHSEIFAVIISTITSTHSLFCEHRSLAALLGAFSSWSYFHVRFLSVHQHASACSLRVKGVSRALFYELRSFFCSKSASPWRQLVQVASYWGQSGSYQFQLISSAYIDSLCWSPYLFQALGDPS